MIYKLFKKMASVILSIIVISIIIGLTWYQTSPEFGGEISKSKLKEYEKIDHFKAGVFVNNTPTSMDMPAGKFISIMIDFIKGNPKGKPAYDISVSKIDSTKIANNKTVNQLTWFGHSAFLVELDKHKILIDPMLGNVPAPHPLLGSARYSKELPISIEKLPFIDAVIISHDHYDHLDYGSIQKLKAKVGHFYVPLGVDAHLIEWGIDSSKITALDWWETAELNDISFIFTPSRHFSGRGISNRFTTLWGSWIIKGKNDNIFFSGDGGYGPHFKEIGDKYGPFDFSMLECGQYSKDWADIHMMPEESAQAAKDLNTKVMMPIHWGAFTLALHDWTEPVERVIKAAKKLKIPISTPEIGKTIEWKKGAIVFPWWNNI
tara:strand:+ start:777 stop:1904 length:1128 start_codon:yes stop_codon:yes gene_type:complete